MLTVLMLLSIRGQLVLISCGTLKWTYGSFTEIQRARGGDSAGRARRAGPGTYLYPVHEGRQSMGFVLRAGARSSPDPGPAQVHSRQLKSSLLPSHMVSSIRVRSEKTRPSVRQMYGYRAVQQPWRFVRAASVMVQVWGKYRRGSDHRGLLQRRLGGSNDSRCQRADWARLSQRGQWRCRTGLVSATRNSRR